MLNRKSMVVMALALLLLTLVPTPAMGDGGSFFYIFGVSTCPYCRALDQFFTQVYPGKSYFCKADLNDVCLQNFRTVLGILATKGIPQEELGGVPTTLVIKDWKYILAVVIGAVTDKNFWDNIVSTTPKEKIQVFVPEQSTLKAYEVSISFDEQQNIVSRYLIIPQSTTSPFSRDVLIPIILIGVGVAVIAYSLIGRRK